MCDHHETRKVWRWTSRLKRIKRGRLIQLVPERRRHLYREKFNWCRNKDVPATGFCRKHLPNRVLLTHIEATRQRIELAKRALVILLAEKRRRKKLRRC